MSVHGARARGGISASMIAWDELGQQIAGAAKSGLDVAVPAIKAGIEAAAPEVQRAMGEGATTLKQTAEELAPLAQRAANVIAPAVESTAPILGRAVSGAVSGTSDVIRSTLAPEQQVQLDEAARVGAQVGSAVGGVARGAAEKAAPIVEEGLRRGVPMVQQGVQGAVDGATPMVDELWRTGTVAPETVERARGDTVGALSTGVKGITDGLRALVPETATAPETAVSTMAAPTAVAAPTAAPATQSALPKLPSTKEMSDSLATSLVQASAPYALGLFLLSFVLAALRELARPLEQVVRNTLAVATLVGCSKLAADNWDTIYGLYQLVSR